jgi:spore germination protein YaaH
VVRNALGLSATTPTPVTAQSAPQATPTPVGPASGFLYQVQPSDSWDSIAATFGVTARELRQWNEAGGDGDPVPGSLVFIPRQL